MQRRRFFGVLAVGSAVALGAGYWRLPAGPAPAALSIEAALALLQRLAGEPLVSRQGWSPAEVFNHCAQSVEYSLEGYPQLKPVWFRQSLGPAAFAVFGLRGAMLSIGLDLEAKGIRVGSILPAATETPMLLKEAVHGGNPLQFMDPPQKPADVAELVAFLATGADFMTGQLLILDGGETIR